MLLYHVSADVDVQERLFTPRVPELSRKAKEIEDILIPRICFAESVSGCFSALPKYSRQKLAKPEARFVLYQIDTDELPSDAFVSNRKIVEKCLVYVSLTRARKEAYITYTGKPSEVLNL